MKTYVRGPRPNLWCALLGHKLGGDTKYCLRDDCGFSLASFEWCVVRHKLGLSDVKNCLSCSDDAWVGLMPKDWDEPLSPESHTAECISAHYDSTTSARCTCDEGGPQ